MKGGYTTDEERQGRAPLGGREEFEREQRQVFGARTPKHRILGCQAVTRDPSTSRAECERLARERQG